MFKLFKFCLQRCTVGQEAGKNGQN